MHKEIDMMPRSLAVTMLAGMVVGSTFWATLAIVMIH